MSGAQHLVIVGAGLAGCEAAWQAARRGVNVVLYEMKPQRFSPAHRSALPAELVCSNSLRSSSLSNAVGLLKEEMRRLGSVVLAAADANAVPAGRALAVDREAFSRSVSDALALQPRIEIRSEVVTKIPTDPLVVLATGPLTAPELASDLRRRVGGDELYFYDAIAPSVYADSIDYEQVFRASRYEDEAGDYLNLPLDAEAYHRFVAELIEADTVPLHAFEQALYFEGCLPVEEMAKRGSETLAHGPLKPVGLRDPRSGRCPYAVVQLRQENKSGTLFNLVGFQTKLRIPDQRRIFSSLPGLQHAVFARFGSVHRNTFVNAPRCLTPSLELREQPGLFLAGQMTGVEGYVESAALGLLAGVNAAAVARGLPIVPVPPDTAHGALLRHLMDSDPRSFQPSNVNFGLFPEVGGARGRRSRSARREALAERALSSISEFRDAIVPVLE